MPNVTATRDTIEGQPRISAAECDWICFKLNLPMAGRRLVGTGGPDPTVAGECAGRVVHLSKSFRINKINIDLW
jgi:hypothetical protein